MRNLVKYLVAVAFLGGVAGVASAQAQPPNPGSILWYAGYPKVTNAPAAPANAKGSIAAGGNYTENAGWKLTGVALYVNEVLAGGQLGPNLDGPTGTRSRSNLARTRRPSRSEPLQKNTGAS